MATTIDERVLDKISGWVPSFVAQIDGKYVEFRIVGKASHQHIIGASLYKIEFRDKSTTWLDTGNTNIYKIIPEFEIDYINKLGM